MEPESQKGQFRNSYSSKPNLKNTARQFRNGEQNSWIMSEVVVKADKMQEKLYIENVHTEKSENFNHDRYHLLYWAHNNHTDLRGEM